MDKLIQYGVTNADDMTYFTDTDWEAMAFPPFVKNKIKAIAGESSPSPVED